MNEDRGRQGSNRDDGRHLPNTNGERKPIGIRRSTNKADRRITTVAARLYRNILVFCGVAAALSSAFAQTLTESEVRRQQEMLIWTTEYEGLIDGNVGPETIKAIKKFQARMGNPVTGQLTPAEVADLVRQGRAKKERAAFSQTTDNDAGVSVGIPLNWVSPSRRTKWGNHWYSKQAGLAIDTLRFSGDVTLQQLYDRLISINNRRVAYRRFVDDNWFVIAAFEGEAAVYVRANVVTLPNQQSEIRGFSIWMSKDRPRDYDALPPAMLSSFRSNTGAAGPQPAPPLRPSPGPEAGRPAPPPPAELPRNGPPIRADGPAASIGGCYRGLGECPPVLTFR
jgi:serine protease Do